MKKSFYEEAINDCNQLLKIDKSNAGAYYIRGCAHEKLGEIDKGIEDLTTALEIDPYHVSASFQLASCENKRGNYAKANEEYIKALEKDLISKNKNK